jgi:hypothetical protein
MKNKLALLIITVCCFSFGYSQKEVPIVLQKVIDAYFTDSTNASGFDYAERTMNINFKDIYAGVPIEVYGLDMNKLFTLSDSEPVDAFITPTGRWNIPIYARGHCIYWIIAYPKGDSSWYIGGSKCCESPEGWDKVRTSWPEKNGIHPIKVVVDSYEMLYFPQRGNHNLTLISGFSSDSLFTTDDYNVLKDSKKLLSHLKERRSSYLKSLEESKKSENKSQ